MTNPPTPEPVEVGLGDLLDAADTTHEVTRTPYPWGVAWTCACGDWEGVATGPSSAAWCQRNHEQHVRDAGA